MFDDEEIRKAQEEEQRSPGQKSKPQKSKESYWHKGEAFPRDPRAISEVSRLNSARFSLARLGGRESKCSCKISVARSAAKSNLDFLLLMG